MELYTNGRGLFESPLAHLVIPIIIVSVSKNKNKSFKKGRIFFLLVFLKWSNNVSADKIIVAGEAGSHCVKNTVEDIADGFGDDTYVQKMVLLEDGVSPVQSPFVDFPAIQVQFITDMKTRGMKTANTTDF